LELPVTILYLNSEKIRKKLYSLTIKTRINSITGIMNRLKIGPLWLRPFPYMSTKDLIGVCKKAKTKRIGYIEMMLHSSELMPGGSPYFPDDISISKLFIKIEKLFRYLDKDGFRGKTLYEFSKEFKKNNDVNE